MTLYDSTALDRWRHLRGARNKNQCFGKCPVCCARKLERACLRRAFVGIWSPALARLISGLPRVFRLESARTSSFGGAMTRSDIIDLAEGCGEKPVAVATQFARKEPAARRYLLDHHSGMLAAARGMTARRGALAVAQSSGPT